MAVGLKWNDLAIHMLFLLWLFDHAGDQRHTNT